MISDALGAPPLGQRPTEPKPGKESLADPRGVAKESHDDAQQADGGGKSQPESCPDCGLPFGQHPEFHMHGGGGGNVRWTRVDLGDADRDADALPGRRLDQEIGGDPAEA